MTEDDILFLDTVDIELPPLSSTGYVLDIGGGGEGVIGRIEGLQVVAIDCREDELAEAPEGPLKVVMDARNLHFLDCTFFAATAFFSLMYFDDETGLQAALAEVFRVLKPGGLFHIWDVDTSTLPESTKTLFAVRIKFIVNGIASETAYGRPWPQKRRDHKYYIGLAETAGFVHTDTESRGHTFCSTFRKTRSIELPKPDARDGL
jgi:ubiquinone/menaquinone biosynthesis C-methylase UbiE